MNDDPGTGKFKSEDLRQSSTTAQDLFSQDEIESLADLMSDDAQDSTGNLDDTGKFTQERS